MTSLNRQTIPLKALAAVLERIIAGYAERGVSELSLSGDDFYLLIGTDEMFDVYTTPQEPMPVGSLVDDLTELGKLLDDPEPFPTAVDIERLGNVLRAISARI